MRPPSDPAAFCGIPSFFRACCADVKCQRLHVGYEHPARELTRHLEDPFTCCPEDLDFDVWDNLLERLGILIRQRDDKGIEAWFVEHFPKCMALVPKRRRNQFLSGVYDAVEAGIAGPILRAQQAR